MHLFNEIKNLFSAEDLEEIKQALNGEEDYYAKLIGYVRKNFHLVFCFDPQSKVFKKWTNLFPAIIANSTITVFSDWNESSLFEVSSKFLSSLPSKVDVSISELSRMCVHIHMEAQEEAEKMYRDLNRRYATFQIDIIEFIFLLEISSIL